MRVSPPRSNRVLTRFSRTVEVSQVRFCTAIDLLSGESDQLGHRRAAGEYAANKDDAIVLGKTCHTLSGSFYSPVPSLASDSCSSYYELVGAGAPINFMAL